MFTVNDVCLMPMTYPGNSQAEESEIFNNQVWFVEPIDAPMNGPTSSGGS
jgi:hypothetical protein